jgi:hypothetical protein
VTQLWEEFLRALAANQADRALQLLSADLRPEIAAAFSSPTADLPAFAAKVRRFDVIDVLPCVVRAFVIRDTEEGERGFSMLFSMHLDGSWEIATL